MSFVQIWNMYHVSRDAEAYEMERKRQAIDRQPLHIEVASVHLLTVLAQVALLFCLSLCCDKHHGKGVGESYSSKVKAEFNSIKFNFSYVSSVRG